jgi:hypothetical protein
LLQTLREAVKANAEFGDQNGAIGNQGASRFD